MWEVLILLPLLFYFSLEDIKKREIPDELVYISYGVAVLLGVSHETFLYSLIVTAAIAVLLYAMGAFALGDVWILLIIGAGIPYTLFGVPISLLSLTFAILLSGLYGMFVVLRKKSHELLSHMKKSVLLAIPFSIHPFLGILAWVFLPERYYLLFLPLGVVSFNLNFFLAIVLLSAVIYLLRIKKLLRYEETVKEGVIPAEVIDKEGKRYDLNINTLLKIQKGEILPVHNIGADGLTEEDVKRLKEMGINSIRAHLSIPFIPFITLGVICSLALFIVCGGGVCSSLPYFFSH